MMFWLRSNLSYPYKDVWVPFSFLAFSLNTDILYTQTKCLPISLNFDILLNFDSILLNFDFFHWILIF